ncbi:MAG TPA: class II fructose-bisphosphate aldolase [Syntrophales bacterium]|nr:class II fructose-bisphosphate aldolase [Syntrophales bacterium]HOX94464.1 class II fructose-bisphosphate aldolase [Syntrophales bacterium]HPI58449.1 class II fructose-bisphosphate aldolase [Syntrophales bacterium]HPN25949.1 class II fructose-bisphosphate aldolase [Syntrophales bacterium]HQM28787.1 class II fructose-bisphosphate aldolase [Syntrophales bacterium]
MVYNSVDALKKGVSGVLQSEGDSVRVLDEARLRASIIDDLVYTAVLSPDEGVKEAARWIIRRAGAALGIIPSSIHALYEAMGRGEVSGFTVPAINLRGLAYESAQAVFRAALRGKVGPVIFEIARSEIGYTEQRPVEYAVSVTAAAIKSGYRGPIFLQGDHFQVSAKKFAADPAREVDAVKELVREGIQAGFYNIDIDSSTVVDLGKATVEEQQRNNAAIAADITALVREIEPRGITTSVGGEIGEVGGKNSTVEELRGFMTGYRKELAKKGKGLKGLSKISVQTGTSHGGVVLPDGSIAKVKLDFDTLETLSKAARKEFGMSGAVQHGASTLPDEAFDHFPKRGTAEVHLATAFQNMIYDHPAFPGDLRKRIYDYIRKDLASEKGAKDTDEQFIYKTRKKGFGPFKKDMWNLPPDVLKGIGKELEEKFYFLFEKLNVLKTDDIVRKFIRPVDVPVPAPPSLSGKGRVTVQKTKAEAYDEGE